MIVSSFAEESPQFPAGVVESASYPSAAGGPVYKAFDHIPCSLYISTAQVCVPYRFSWWLNFRVVSQPLKKLSYSNNFQQMKN